MMISGVSWTCPALALSLILCLLVCLLHQSKTSYFYENTMLTDMDKYFSIIKSCHIFKMTAGSLFIVGGLWPPADGWDTSL
jgi:hypothetical protein